MFQKVFLAAVLLAGFASADNSITVAVAANAQYAMEEIKAAFKKETGIEVKTVYGASGKFATQIRSGAPFDVFVSADMDFPDSVYAWGQAAEKPKPYARGKLVLWTLKNLDLGKGLSVLNDSSIAHIAVADPKKAPYGREAVNALKKSGMYASDSSRLVYGESISQVTQYIVTQNVDIGFDAKSVVLAGEVKGKGKWVEVDSTLYHPIEQGAVVCKYGKDNNPKLAEGFLNFLYSDSARAILVRYGYALP